MFLFSFWQSIFIALLVAVGAIGGFWVYNAFEAGIVINSALICFEMCIVAILHMWAYPVDLYRILCLAQAPLLHAVHKQSVLESMKHSLTQADTVKDALSTFGGRSKGINNGDEGAQVVDFDTDETSVDFSLEEDDIKTTKQARR